MAQLRTATRTPIVFALVLIALLGPFLARSAIGRVPSAIPTVAPRGVIVVGDSITAQYNDNPGDDMQGWWSIVGRHFDAKVTTYAQSGSGYLRPGKLCTGNRFIDRQKAFLGEPPSLLIVEGGRNDWAGCDGDQFVRATDDAIELAVDTYLNTLTTFLPRSTRIIVMGPPWGPLDPTNGKRVTAIIEASATKLGLEFIPTTGALTEARVLDGVHPNREGSVAIANRVISALD